jgi:hypothetical protein
MIEFPRMPRLVALRSMLLMEALAKVSIDFLQGLMQQLVKIRHAPTARCKIALAVLLRTEIRPTCPVPPGPSAA